MNYKDKANKEDLLKFKDDNLKKLDALITLGIESSSNSDYKRSALIAYWLQDFTRYLLWEKEFSPQKLKRYERGDILKVNLGFNIGNEQGGMHYAVVLDKENAVRSGTITIIPLSSKKPDKPLHPLDVDLGNDIYTKLRLKFKDKRNDTKKRIEDWIKIRDALQKVQEAEDYSDDSLDPMLQDLNDKIKLANRELSTLKKIGSEITQMKAGSVGLVSQITTVSKMRIYDPRTTGGVLSGIKLSPEGLELINQKIHDLFVG